MKIPYKKSLFKSSSDGRIATLQLSKIDITKHSQNLFGIQEEVNLKNPASTTNKYHIKRA